MTYKCVDFYSLEILEFHYIVGDNPSVSEGCPVALGTELVSRSTYDIDLYETCRGERKHGRRLTLSVLSRAKILLERGYSIDEIAEGTIQGDKARSERYSSIAAQNWDKVNALSERFGRVLRKALPTVGGLKKHTTAATTA